MIKAILSDFSRVIVFPKDKEYQGSLNGLYKEISQKPNYNMFDSFEVNTELLDFYRSLKANFRIYIFTSELIQEDPQFTPYLRPVFNDMYSAIKIGMSKNDPQVYARILKDIDL